MKVYENKKTVCIRRIRQDNRRKYGYIYYSFSPEKPKNLSSMIGMKVELETLTFFKIVVPWVACDDDHLLYFLGDK